MTKLPKFLKITELSNFAKLLSYRSLKTLPNRLNYQKSKFHQITEIFYRISELLKFGKINKFPKFPNYQNFIKLLNYRNSAKLPTYQKLVKNVRKLSKFF